MCQSKSPVQEAQSAPAGWRDGQGDWRWEVVSSPPLEVLEKMLADTASEHKWAEQRMSRYKAAIDARESPPAGEGNAIELLRRAMDSAGLPDEFRAPMIGYFCNELNAAPQEGGEK